MLQPTEDQIKQYGSMPAAERRKKLRDVEDELTSLYTSQRLAKVHGASETYRERRVESLKAEIERLEQVTARKIAFMKRDIEKIQKESESLPAIIESNKRRIGILETERKLLKSHKALKALSELMELADA